MHRFLTPSGLHGNVVFNLTGSPIDDLGAFALGYRRAGRALAARLAETRGYADYDGYPVLFLYRHSLELYLKAIVYKGARLIQLISPDTNVETQRLFQRHGLLRLLPAIAAIFRQMEWTLEDSGIHSLDDLADLLRSLDSVDPGSYSFRYPIRTDGNALHPKHLVVNVLEFADGMDALLRLLEGALAGITEEWSAEAEARYELQRLSADWQSP